MIADKQTDRQTDTLITILRFPIAGGVTSCYNRLTARGRTAAVLGLPYVRLSPDTSSFFGLCPGVQAGFRKSAVCPGFWPNPQVHSNVANCKGVRRHETKKARYSIQERQGILFVQHNFKHLSWRDFYTYLQVQSTEIAESNSFFGLSLWVSQVQA